MRPEAAARFAGAGALVLFLCWQHVQATSLGYRVETTRKEALKRRGRVTALRVELDGRLSPENVAAGAARMGLVPASPEALRLLPGRGAPETGVLSRLWARLDLPGRAFFRG